MFTNGNGIESVKKWDILKESKQSYGFFKIWFNLITLITIQSYITGTVEEEDF